MRARSWRSAPKRRLASGAAKPSSTISAQLDPCGAPSAAAGPAARSRSRWPGLRRPASRRRWSGVDVLQRRRRGTDDHDLVCGRGPRGSWCGRPSRSDALESVPSRPVVVDPGGAVPEGAGCDAVPDRRLRRSPPRASSGRRPSRPRGAATPPGSLGSSAFAARAPISLQQHVPSLEPRKLRVPVRVGLGRGHHGAPVGVFERCRSARSRRARLGALTGRRLGALRSERTGARLGELHVVGDRLGVLARDVLDHLRVHPGARRATAGPVR